MTTRQKLEAVSQNLWWSWNPNARDLFRDIAPDVYESSTHAPLAALKAASDDTLNDAKTADRIDAVYADFRSYMDTPGSKAKAPTTAYFCMEYGLHESLALYSGGLGILAGDHCKAASDLSVPFTAVGLLLRDGYFKQKFDGKGWQVEEYPVMDPAEHPMTLLTGRDGKPRRVTVHLGDEPLRLQAWELNVGRTRLLLLDSDHDENPAHLRPLTRKLYQGDRRIRLQQEIVLGIGGLRMLRALNVATEVYHLNEGHCAFLLFELMRERMATGETREAAEQWVTDHCVFTTHTPVLAGHDRFEPDLLLGQLWKMRDALHMSNEEILAYGRVKPDDHQEWFTMTVLGLNISRAANGVSKLNGEVAREQWSQMYPDRPTAEVPIGHVTNGIHLPTWTAQPAREFASKHLGDWEADRVAPTFWQKIDKVSDADVWALRNVLRKRLVDFAEQHVAEQTMKQTFGLSPDTLTIGFARRFATYKRAPLFFYDVERAGKILSDADRPGPTDLRRQSAPRRRGRQALHPADLRDDAEGTVPGPRALPGELQHGDRPDARQRLRRVAQQSAPPDGSVGHERAEGQRARRPQPLDPRRLVARRLRRQQRLVHRRRRLGQDLDRPEQAGPRRRRVLVLDDRKLGRPRVLRPHRRRARAGG